MPRIKQTERQHTFEQTRQRLLLAAANEFSQAGYLGANINAISIAAGYAKGTVYNYFPSKQALLLALIDDTAQRHLDFVQQRTLAESQPIQRLKCFFQAGFEFVASHLPQARVMLNTIYGADETLKQHAFEAYQPLFRLIAEEILAPGMAQGVFQDLEPGRTATLLMTVYLGTASHIDAQGRFWLEAEQVARLALYGISKTPGDSG
ncbi:MAG: TetR/AcrR family transcriptional regulator [Chloroflexota bacterium]